MIKVVDNFLPEGTFKSLRDTLLGKIPWTYLPGSVIKSNENDLGNFFFTHNLNDNKPLINFFEEKINQEFLIDKKIFIQKCVVNLTTLSKHGFHADAHIDRVEDHYVLILYMNNTDGDTIIYDELWDNSKPEQYKDKETLKIAKIISPKENRSVFFDGRLFHSYYFPKQHNRRIVINMNIFIKE